MSWNYRYGPQYGSPEYSKALRMIGHDYLAVKGAHVLEDGRSLFIEVQKSNQRTKFICESRQHRVYLVSYL